MRISQPELPSRNKRLVLAKLIFGSTLKGTVKVEERVVLDHVDLKIGKEEIFGLLEPNGAGKTTLLDILSTMILPDEGETYVLGFDLTREAKEVRRVITPFSALESNNRWTGRQNLEYIAALYGMEMGRVDVRIGEVLKLLGLEERADDIVERYSSGMRKKLSFAMSLLVDHPIYLMDEPFVGLDPAISKEMLDFIKRELKSRDRTIVIATHLLSSAEELCDRIALINEGRIVAVDTIENLKRSLPAKESLKIEVLNPAEEMKEKMENIDGVLSLVASKVEGPEKVLTIQAQVSDSKVVLPEAVEVINKGGGKVRYVKVSEPTLEDVFIHYTGRKIQ